MPQPVLKEIKSPLATELAEYQVLIKDLVAAYAALDLWFNKYASLRGGTAEDTLISQALFRDSIVMFVGCFDKTAPLSLPVSDIYKTQNERDYFQWLLDMRDAYAAHKFGALRQCVVGVFVDDAGNVLGAGHNDRIWAGPRAAAKTEMLMFMGAAFRYTERKILDLSRQLTETAKALTPAELAALNVAKTHAVEPHEIRLSRRKFRTKGP